jgi:hypothetical protein
MSRPDAVKRRGAAFLLPQVSGGDKIFSKKI